MKKIICIVLAILMICSMVPIMASASIPEVDYIDENGNWQTASNVTAIDENSYYLGDGWYVVDESINFNTSITITGDVKLIVEDNRILHIDASDSYGKPGINVTGNTSLTIYGQEEQTGEIFARGGDTAAGIGSDASNNSGTITINGCSICGIGGTNGAGIGGGSGTGGNVVINNGYVNAYGGSGASAIGDGYIEWAGFVYRMSNITINGGNVYGCSYEYLTDDEEWVCQPGIGGYYANITINGGEVFGQTEGENDFGIGANESHFLNLMAEISTRSSLKISSNLVLEASNDRENWVDLGDDYSDEYIKVLERGTTVTSYTDNILLDKLCGKSITGEYTVDKYRYVKVAAHTHNYTELVSEIEATCTTNGSITYKCSCGEMIKLTVDATGHDYETTVVAPTCTTEGYTKYQCKNCEDSYIDNVTEKTEHNYEVTVIEPTCKHAGYTEYRCKDCEYSYKADYNPGDVFNLHKYGETITINPTCTIGGHTTEKCEVCGYVHTISETDALGHDTIIINQKDATTEETGYSGDVYCTRCSKIIEYGEVIEKIEPITEEPTEPITEPEEDTDNDSNVCPTCGKVHQFGWICNLWCKIKHFFMNLFKTC